MRTGFGIIGGDRRQLCLAHSIAEDGYEVIINGMEQETDCAGLTQSSLVRLAERCNVIIFPLPATRDGRQLNAPFSDHPIRLGDDLARMLEGHMVFGGMLEKLKASSLLWEHVNCQDYYTQEELITGNAFLTAEAAIGVAIQEYPGSLAGAQCLVAGFGRIGKALCGMLKGMGAQVFCGARKPADHAAIHGMGCTPLVYRELARPFHLIFNTVPARVIGKEILSSQRADTLLIELASAPGGIDVPAAERLGLRVLAAPSLPGRMSPKAAGELIKHTIYHMIEETEGECCP